MPAEVVSPNIPAALLGLGILLYGFLAFAIYLRNYARGKTLSPLGGNLVPILPLPAWWIFVFLLIFFGALQASSLTKTPILFPVSIVLPLLIIIHAGKAPSVLWNLDWNRIPSFLKSAILILSVSIIPLLASSLLAQGLYALLGLEWKVQDAIVFLLDVKDPRVLAYFIFLAVVIAPICEEAAFRGCLYPMLKHHLGKGWAIALSSALFAVAHMDAPTLIPLTLLGVLLAMGYERTGSLLTSISMHALFNLMTCTNILILKFG